MMIGTQGEDMMAGRNLVRGCLDIAFAVALLVAVMTSPIRPLVSKPGAPRANYLRRNFGLPPNSSRLTAITDMSRPASVGILLSESEEEPNAAISPSPGSFDLPFQQPFKPPARDLASDGQILTPRPLRC